MKILTSEAVKAIYGFADVIERLDKKYYQTGIKKIDDAKISKSDYVIIGGRPSSGKTGIHSSNGFKHSKRT